MKTHITYAHGRFLQSKKLCSDTAISKGGADVSFPLGLEHIDPKFIEDNSYIFSHSKGAGYWLWKPYLILKYLKEMKSTDWLMYTDSGLYFQKSPWDYILRYETDIEEKGIITFGECGTNANFCKRDAFVLMDLDTPHFTNSLQRTASIFVCKKTEFSINFVEEWLKYGCDPRIITDLPNSKGLPNYSDFIDHRWDQSIMSLLCKKYDTLVLDDLTHWSGKPDPYIIHTRNPN
jgi:hypothetical protein